jgi:site-specific recombinase XerD
VKKQVFLFFLLLNAPDTSTLKGKRDRAILSTLLYHGIRREELAISGRLDCWWSL